MQDTPPVRHMTHRRLVLTCVSPHVAAGVIVVMYGRNESDDSTLPHSNHIPMPFHHLHANQASLCCNMKRDDQLSLAGFDWLSDLKSKPGDDAD